MPTPLGDADKVLRNDTGKSIASKLDDIKNAIDGLNEPNKADKGDLASISITGTTNNTGSTIPTNKFFYLNGLLVIASADIANGDTFTENTNYTVVTAGVLNSLGLLQTVTPSGSDKLLIVQSQGQGLSTLDNVVGVLNGTVTTVTADGITWTVVKQGRLYDMYAVIPVSTSNPISWGSLYVYRNTSAVYGLPVALTKKLVDLSYGTGSATFLQGLYTDLGSNYNSTTAADVIRPTPTSASSVDVYKYIRGYV